MATILAQSLVDQTRVESDLNGNQVLSDQDIATMLSDAGSDLYDLFTGANQLYNVTTFDFTLAGGVGGNTVPLPADFQQGHSVDVNPNTSNPYTLKYLSNWLERNSVAGSAAIWAAPGGPRSYAFVDGNLMVFPPMAAAGVYRLYYTPQWRPLALPLPVDVESASIAITCDGSVTGFGPGQNFFGFGNPFLPTDVGCSVGISGASNSDNNGSFTVTGYISSGQITLSGSHTTETFATSAHVTLIRQSHVVSGTGVWTLYGDNPFTNASLSGVNVGDSLVVSGAANAGNNGTFVITAIGANTITAVATGLVTENFNGGAFSVQVQPAGTRPDLLTQMNPWVLYLKTLACITIRNKRGQDVSTFEGRLAVQKDRIQTILQSRQDEAQQPPLTRGQGGFWGTW